MLRHIKLLSVFALCVALLALGMLLGSGIDLDVGQVGRLLHGKVAEGLRSSAGGQKVMAAGAEASLPVSFADIAEKVNPAVVFVQVTEVGRRSERMRRGPLGEQDEPDFWEFFHNMPRPREDEFRREGGGSGFIIDRDGWILTNNHVIEDATRVTVKLADDREFKAEVRGTDKLMDVALLKIDPSDGLPVATLGDSEGLRVGDWVMAIGNPFVYEHTVTVGVVSHKGRSSGNPFQQFIQTDAAINFGNSGGPLLNTRGEVVGINTAISAVGQGIGFAIPINKVKDIMTQLKETGKVSRGFLGVQPQAIDDKLREAFPGLPSRDGALVVDVEPGSPADEAGIKVDDVIVEFSGQAVRTREDLFGIVGSTPPGTKVRVKVLREDKKGSGKWVPKSLQAMLVERTLEREDEKRPSRERPGSRELPGKSLGLEVDDVSPKARGSLQLPDKVRGVVVVKVTASGPAADAGLAQGDVISEVNGTPVGSIEDFATAIEGAEPGARVRLRVYRQGTPRYVAVTVAE